MDTASAVSLAITSAPRLHVTAHLPPVISFSSIEEPQLEMQITFQYSRPIIIALKQSRLWPLHLRSALTLNHASSGRYEYVPRVDAPTNGPPTPRLTKEHKENFLGLQPGEKSVVKVSFRPYDEPYDYESVKDKGIDKYRMLWPIGMQFLKPGEEYEVGVGQVQNHAYMIGDLEEIVAEAAGGAEWKSAEGSLEIIAGEKCRFRVEA